MLSKFSDFVATIGVSLLKYRHADSLVDAQNLIHEIYYGEITMKIFCLKNYLLLQY